MQQLLDIKYRYGDICVLQFDETHIAVFRPLRWKEFLIYRSLLQNISNIEQEIQSRVLKDCLIEYLCETIYYSEDADNIDVLDDMPAGAAETIYNVIMIISGPMTTEKFMEDLAYTRAIYNDPEDIILKLTQIGLSINSNINFDNMYYYDILKYVVLYEYIQMGYVPKVPFGVITQEQEQPQKTQSTPIDFERENKLYYKEFGYKNF